ncbi:dynamin family protein [Ornithinibacillus contaminans]|uniref:dynamin family protein n=1 Tax=Ornithinibacillus contaminans TaxID=694055 RepID=UPI00069EBDFB|nr:dynamin family protein [Ornithinibacillus contaminans]
MRAVRQNHVIENEQLSGLYHVMHEHGDVINARKILDLFLKKEKNEFVLSFAGHFSAGKSSMINALMGTEILPKSPIPTSANIVKLTSGEAVARVYFHQEDPIEFNEPYDMDMIKEYCKDKDTITKIEISTSKQIIPQNSAILDTPGIDAADDTDRLITESSLHLVDVLFYVMDYHHVQSEVNLYFLKKIQVMNIPYYIIINQIDKHNEAEIPFQAFEKSIKQTFDSWNLTPELIYYSSLLTSDKEHNQFPEIQQKVDVILREERISRLDASVRNVMEAHIKFLHEQMDEAITAISIEDSNYEDVVNQLKSVDAAIDALTKKCDHVEKDFNEAVEQTLKNAYLMPAVIRDKALLLLESQQKEFKVGRFASKRKTDEARETRLQDFLASLQESMQANIEWKLRDKFHSLLQQYNMKDNELYTAAQEISISFGQQQLLELIKKGAKVSGDAVLHYTNDVSQAIKTNYRKAARNLLIRIQEVMTEAITTEINQLNEIRNDYEKQLQAHHTYNEIREAYQERINHVVEQLFHPTFSDDLADIRDLVQQEFRMGTTNMLDRPASIKETERNDQTNSTISVNDTPTFNRVVEAIHKTIQTIEGLVGFDAIIQDLTEKKNRLENRTLTIALFGAFSAGKSSFANALIGEGLLPASPNPTTAVINRIVPPTQQYSHGSVRIQLKDEHTLLQDLAVILKHLSPPNTENLGELIGWMVTNDVQHSQELSTMYQAYLAAVMIGYDEHKDIIGDEITITLNDFSSYVTDETKACYVESIDLYYDCSITRKGITLVDTPGADSVNARHTNVAFDYIKNADAILYVTYYNHALTKADRDFVLQLGRVKDSFQLDKMFFILNAADLAKDQAELNLVCEYVEEQLLKLGVRNARIFPVSSKQSLEEKLQEYPVNKQMQRFESTFYTFLEQELAQLVIESSILDLKRTRNILENLIAKANLNQQEKERYKQALRDKQSKLIEFVTSGETTLYEEKISQKITKQLHYVVERVGIRFHDMFKDSFNPTTVTESGKNASYQLQKNMVNLLDGVGYELLQEVRAVSLRIEAYLNEQLADLLTYYQQHTHEVNQDFTFSSSVSMEIKTPEYSLPLTAVDINTYQKALDLFKGTKSFFEKNEKEKMKDALYVALLPEIKAFISDSNRLMDTHYGNEWNKLVVEQKSSICHAINQYTEANIALMEDNLNTAQLEDKHQRLNEVLIEFN